MALGFCGCGLGFYGSTVVEFQGFRAVGFFSFTPLGISALDFKRDPRSVKHS